MPVKTSPAVAAGSARFAAARISSALRQVRQTRYSAKSPAVPPAAVERNGVSFSNFRGSLPGLVALSSPSR